MSEASSVALSMRWQGVPYGEVSADYTIANALPQRHADHVPRSGCLNRIRLVKVSRLLWSFALFAVASKQGDSRVR